MHQVTRTNHRDKLKTVQENILYPFVLLFMNKESLTFFFFLFVSFCILEPMEERQHLANICSGNFGLSSS